MAYHVTSALDFHNRGGYRIPHRRGCQPYRGPTYDFAKFSKKLHEIEKILVCMGVHTGGAPLDLPLNKVGYVIQI